jgi:CubicO group peptidase (beta-lactamase class C family)
MKKITLILLIGILFSCNLKSRKEKSSLQENQVLSDSLTIELNNIYKQGHINGFSVSIVNEHKTLYQNGFGFSDIKAKKSYTENTIQNIASISKTLLGVSLLKAQELGKLNLDEPIEKYLPFEVRNPYHPELPIKINHLATHTSTIMDTEFYDKSYVLKDDIGKLDIDIPMKDFLKDILSTDGKLYKKDGFLKNKPGEVFEYTNIGATLAAIVLEMATGEKYDDFSAKYILKPAKMVNSGWSFDSIDLSNYSILYKTDQTEYPRYKLITYPDGGFITSANDLSLFLSELIRGYSGSGSLLSVESYKTLFKVQLGEDNFSDRGTRDYSDEYNTGIFMGFTPNGHIGHTGGDPGVSTFMFFNPKTKLGRMLIVNTDLEEEGWQQFIDIWNKLDEFSTRLK